MWPRRWTQDAHTPQARYDIGYEYAVPDCSHRRLPSSGVF
jgi:hypothetical protein